MINVSLYHMGHHLLSEISHEGHVCGVSETTKQIVSFF